MSAITRELTLQERAAALSLMLAGLVHETEAHVDVDVEALEAAAALADGIRDELAGLRPA